VAAREARQLRPRRGVNSARCRLAFVHETLCGERGDPSSTRRAYTSRFLACLWWAWIRTTGFNSTSGGNGKPNLCAPSARFNFFCAPWTTISDACVALTEPARGLTSFKLQPSCGCGLINPHRIAHCRVYLRELNNVGDWLMRKYRSLLRLYKPASKLYAPSSLPPFPKYYRRDRSSALPNRLLVFVRARRSKLRLLFRLTKRKMAWLLFSGKKKIPAIWRHEAWI
jgi:hypothetical protein